MSLEDEVLSLRSRTIMGRQSLSDPVLETMGFEMADDPSVTSLAMEAQSAVEEPAPIAVMLPWPSSKSA
jgi:hypothetical protein